MLKNEGREVLENKGREEVLGNMGKGGVLENRRGFNKARGCVRE